MAQFENAREFAQFVKGLGFKAYVATKYSYRGGYGFLTDETGSRVLCFSFTDGGSLSGTYGPPSRESGTGWRMDETPYDLRTAEDVRKALYAHPQFNTGGGWKRFTTVAEHLAMYGESSGYVEV